MNILLLFLLIVLNGLFAMSEIAFLTSRKSRLQHLADNGDASALAALRLNQDPTRFLSTVQIGITVIGILNGVIGEAALGIPLEDLFTRLGMERHVSSVVATGLVVAGITYVSIVIGELVPKRLAQANAEAFARVLARPVAFLALASRPFVILLSASTNLILRALGRAGQDSAGLTEEDIEQMLAEGSETGVIEKHEQEMVRNVFRLDDRQIVSLMTPRHDIVWIDLVQPYRDNLETIIAADYSHFPVCEGGMHEILGVIPAKRLLKMILQQASQECLRDELLPAVYVPESLTGMKLLEQFRESGVPMVFVVDEYGEILGLVTVQDVLEALTGEFRPRDPEDIRAVQRKDGSWLLDGLLPVQELKDRLNLKNVPEEEKGHYHTLSGMLMWLIGKIPRPGDSADWQGWSLEVVDLDGNRIDKVLASRQQGPTDQAPRDRAVESSPEGGAGAGDRQAP